MAYDYWKTEVRRLTGALLLGVVLGLISGYWLINFLLVACLYIGWVLYKLRQLQAWLIGGQKAYRMPDSDGVWEQITYLIHKSKQKSQSRKKKQRDLLMRFNNIMAALPDGAVLLSQEHEIQWMNRSATRLLGIAQTDTGQRIDNLVRIPELSSYLKQPEQNPHGIRFISPRNENLSLQAVMLPLQKHMFLLNVRDISQRIQLQQSRKAFIANASHELRTPLTVLSGYLELMEHEPELPETLQSPIHQSRDQARRMGQIINDMLALSRLESPGDRQPREDTIPMGELLDNMLPAIQDTLAGDSHLLEWKADPELRVLGVEKDLISVINNLVENAVRHTPEGTRISVHWQQDISGRACLSVQDNGPGIPQQHLNHLTERFYRVDKGRTRDRGGTGLGLAIVKHVMINHQGHLDIRSEPGETVFIACFPVERVVREADFAF
ncbi:MAG: phosphate regulon sensor histidine kinase PhoR [Thiothrix sp.]|nr:phosphate regulon sensor histidine kinase PhoR [Thiothrix sp.]HPQ94949.1 phosphate regulon sensor histidine kinase PhoR [Thiolinea sp.]